MHYHISLEGSSDTFLCDEGQSVLKGMERLGRKGIPVGCRNGGCGVCRVKVIGGGRYRTEAMSRAQITEEDERQGVFLACKLFPKSDLQLQVMGTIKKIFDRCESMRSV